MLLLLVILLPALLHPTRRDVVVRTAADRRPARPLGTSAVPAAALASLVLLAGSAAPAGAASSVRRCGTIAVPSTQARAAVSLRGPALPCTTVRRVVRAAYARSVLIGDTRPFALRDAGRSWRCRYAPTTGGMVCEARGRRLRGTI